MGQIEDGPCPTRQCQRAVCRRAEAASTTRQGCWRRGLLTWREVGYVREEKTKPNGPSMASQPRGAKAEAQGVGKTPIPAAGD